MKQIDKPSPGHDPLAFLAGGGEMGERTRTFDWAKTPVGPVADWPQSLKTAVSIGLGSRYPIVIWWGDPAYTMFYNDAYIPFLGVTKHPGWLGRSGRECWSEIWPTIGPMLEGVFATGEATWSEDLLLVLDRNLPREEGYFTFSYSAILNDVGAVGGIFCACYETTGRVIGERRLRTLRDLSRRVVEAKEAGEACAAAARALAANRSDIPFALTYLLDEKAPHARLVATVGLEAGSASAPDRIDLGVPAESATWPLRRVFDTATAELVPGLSARHGPLPGGPWPESPEAALILPIAAPGQARPTGFLVTGLSPRRVVDADYRGFFDLIAGHIGTAVANARAYEEERRRAEKLAELDRAKTAFFSNVSHEFRTPLTLMLGPVEELLARGPADLSPAAAGQLEVVNRNGLRLLRLVNTLLDFSRIEAGRVRALYQPTDLAAFTADLASQFRAAVERAGLRLVVDCPDLTEPVYVDREMWEKVVLNLLSNAFKFTFEGEIAVTLRQTGSAAELRVRDTGTGIPAGEMPRLFERFHRVENARGRTHEGSGIGLALVQELVKLHGGGITAESAVGQGTTFTVTIPLGKAHLPPDQIGNSRTPVSAGTGAAPYVEEALRWLPDEGEGVWEEGSGGRLRLPSSRIPSPSSLPRVLVADDNADMRQYVARLLAEQFQVEAVADGEAALAAARERPPDLILSDVMMPRLDGFGLLRALRADPRTRNAPVLLLSARAGEESRVEGMEAGADDYLVKPFGARELLARVSAHLQMARLRREAEQAVLHSEERLRLALTAARMVAWVWDPVTDRLVVSDNAADVFGLPPGSRLEHGEQGFALVHPDDVGRHRATVLRAAAECGDYLSQFRMVRKDTGATIWLEDRGHGVCDGPGGAVRLVGVVMDITDRKRADQALRDSEAHFRSMADNAPVMLWVTDPSGFCTYISRQWCEYTGTTLEQNLGAGWLGYVHPDDVAATSDTFLKANGQHAPFRLDYRLRRHDGEYRWAADAGLPRFDGDRFGGYVGCVFDVHDRKLGEEALREADRKKDEFLSILAHELRNPLAPIRNGLQMMKLAPGNPGAVEQARAMMERQLGQMVRLIDDLMDLTRISRGKVVLQKARMPLATAIRNAVEASRPLMEQAGHAFSLDLPEEPVYVDGDETRLAQVFGNLLNNAAKYTNPGGRIRLAVRRQGGEAVVSVEDNGIGIPAPMLSKVFDMFTQVDLSLEKAQGGLGIGLSIVRRLVEMHGGTIVAVSGGHGLGSRFVVRLPVVPPPVGELPGGPERAPPAARRRILVVDDNRDAAISLALMLQLEGNETRTAHDGLEAVEAAEAFRPDVILMDIGMPRLNGYDACRRIRRQPWGKGVLMVACTGWGQDEDRRKSREAGFDTHLVKPVDPDALETLLAGLKATG